MSFLDIWILSMTIPGWVSASYGWASPYPSISCRVCSYPFLRLWLLSDWRGRWSYFLHVSLYVQSLLALYKYLSPWQTSENHRQCRKNGPNYASLCQFRRAVALAMLVRIAILRKVGWGLNYRGPSRLKRPTFQSHVAIHVEGIIAKVTLAANGTRSHQ
jgi:hypothetical protein